jgi:D-tyrosyl-tRNA(Tyr) deacylase
MKAVLMRVRRASVTIDERETRSIGRGFLILLAVTHDDTEAQAVKLADKLCSLRLFEDADGKINLTLDEVGGEIMIVSQFTLYGDCRKGRRPSFTDAANPELGERLYEQFLADCASLGYPPQHGRFGADMKVESINDGPVTLILDTEQLMDTPRRK